MFSQVPVADIPRSRFNRSHGHKTTFDVANLIPIYVDEALPGDTFQVKCTAFARLATPIFPIMDNIYLDFFFFAVPNRLLWDKWERFMGEQPNPGDSIDFLVPQATSPTGVGWQVNTLGDYFGLPTTFTNLVANALPFRAYNLIWNEWFRDQNLQARAPEYIGDGPDPAATAAADYAIRKRGKRHDYFTSCLPWPQKGTAASIFPGTGSTAPVIAGPTNTPLFSSADGFTINQQLSRAAGIPGPTTVGATTSGVSLLRWGAQTGLVADLSQSVATTINQLRQAFAVQRLLERDARGGTRYVELLKSHFGVVSPDFRLQRPEFLGGGTIPVNINPVSQTSATALTGSTTPLGNLAAYGLAAGSSPGFTKSFTEHCTLIGLVAARADMNYYQGMARAWSRRSRYDYYWPAFSHIGEQDVKNKEIYYQGNANDDLPFGYQERWAEYRYFPNRVTGRFRPGASGGDYKEWHLAETFGSLPTLNGTFIQENPPMSRIKAVAGANDFLFDSHFDIACTRPLPAYSVPGMLDHF
ncbi:MAG: major capsid protein [Microviridae sp.]|nr:MAG: major capsid protein [Microviridae sp.]